MPDPTFGEVGRAYVVPVEGGSVDGEAVRAHCRRLLAEYEVPDQVVVVDSLPMTPAGKIRKAALRDAVAEEGGPDNPAARTDPD